MTNEPIDEGLDAIRLLFDELRELIGRTITDDGSRDTALRHLRIARTNCVISAGKRA